MRDFTWDEVIPPGRGKQTEPKPGDGMETLFEMDMIDLEIFDDMLDREESSKIEKCNYLCCLHRKWDNLNDWSKRHKHEPKVLKRIDDISARIKDLVGSDCLCKMPYKDFLKTEYWQKLREQTKERDGNACVVCNGSDRLEVHHRTYKRRGFEHPSDLVTLCHDCHSTFHKKLDQ
jgi:5-methylcytosine-specific restriction endonuclease McrA